MKLIHLSDLHLGKRVNEFSMLEDQAYILLKILSVIDDERPDAVLIAGDVYDKSVPSAEAVELFDDFLVRLAERKLQVFGTTTRRSVSPSAGGSWTRAACTLRRCITAMWRRLP